MFRRIIVVPGKRGKKPDLLDKAVDKGPVGDLPERSSERLNDLGRGVSSDLATSRTSSNGEPPLSTLSRGSALPRDIHFAPWCGRDLEETYFICITIKEGIDLSTGLNLRLADCDPFVRVVLRRPDFPLPLAEAETRVIKDNHNPLWEECLPFPLGDVTAESTITLHVLDKDTVFVSSIGSVTLPMKDVLTKITELGQEHVYRMPLVDRGRELKRGVLVFGVSILRQQQYYDLRRQITEIQDPDKVHDQLRHYRLHMRLHGLGDLTGLPPSAAGALEAVVSLCSFEQRRPLPLRGGSLREGLPAELHEVDVVVPLGEAFGDGDTLKGKNRAQFGEVKVDLYLGKTRLARTQVPIWDVPFRPEPPQPPPPGAAPPQTQQQDDAMPPETPRGFFGSLASAMAGAAAAGVAVARGKSDVSAVPADDAAPGPAAPPPPPPAPLWDGRRYERRMELDKGRDKGLAGPPLLAVSMQLVRAGADAAGAPAGADGGGGADLDAADVDSPAEPLAAPPQLAVPVADFVVGQGPHALFRTLFGNGAEVAQRVAAAERLTDLKVAPWGPDPDGKARAVRSQAYKKPTPVGAATVKAAQKLLSKSDGGFVLENRVTPTLPVGEAVHVFIQLVATHAGPGKTRLSISLRMEWFESGFMVNALKGKVEAESPKDARRWADFVRQELVAAGITVEDAVGGAAAGGVAAFSGAAGAAPGSAAAAGTGAAVGGPLAAGGGAAGGPLVLGLIAVVVLLLFFLWLTLLRLGRSTQALEAVTRALTEAAQARAQAAQQVCAVPPR